MTRDDGLLIAMFVAIVLGVAVVLAGLSVWVGAWSHVGWNLVR